MNINYPYRADMNGEAIAYANNYEELLLNITFQGVVDDISQIMEKHIAKHQIHSREARLALVQQTVSSELMIQVFKNNVLQPKESDQLLTDIRYHAFERIKKYKLISPRSPLVSPRSPIRRSPTLFQFPPFKDK